MSKQSKREASPPEPSEKRPYRPPSLTVYGDVRGLTMGSSPGVGESGAPFVFKA